MQCTRTMHLPSPPTYSCSTCSPLDVPVWCVPCMRTYTTPYICSGTQYCSIHTPNPLLYHLLCVHCTCPTYTLYRYLHTHGTAYYIHTHTTPTYILHAHPTCILYVHLHCTPYMHVLHTLPLHMACYIHTGTTPTCAHTPYAHYMVYHTVPCTVRTTTCTAHMHGMLC